jgi:hypothetical protein
MTQPVSQRQREQDASAWFFKHPPHIPDLHCKVAELSDLLRYYIWNAIVLTRIWLLAGGAGVI